MRALPAEFGGSEPARDAADCLARASAAAIEGRRAARVLAAWARPFQLSEPELQLLWCLREVRDGGCDQTTIAQRLALSPAQVSTTVERLRQRGWIVQQAVAGDRRRHLWRLTESGAALVERIVMQPGGTQPQAAVPASRIAAVLLVAAMVATAGCTRAYYRVQADDEVNCITDNKAIAVGSEPGSFRIDIDPRSRMYDPDDPDCPPMPPDDPVSHELMICVDCKPGAPCWRHATQTPYVENPHWEDYLPRDAEGRVVLDLPGAVELALLQSTDYQEQLETLYLSCLDVTFERFRFDAQYFGGSSIFYTSDGRVRGGGSSSSEFEVAPLSSASPLRVQKLTTTGGELAVGLANSLVWQFSGPDSFGPRTVLDFSLVQPILRAGGRVRVMERLTIAERALLANVRQMEHYRRAFYLNVVTGQGLGFGQNQGLNRRGGFFGGSGLEGFSGVGGGGFGRVGGFGGGGFGGGFGFTGGAGAQQAGGYLGLLQQAQVIRNQYANIAALGDSVEQLQAAHDAGRIDRFQVDLARQALYNAQSQLLNSVAQYETSLDDFKLQYGMPPDLDILVSDPLLDRFNLLSPELSTLQTRVTNLLETLREEPTTELDEEAAADLAAAPKVAMSPDQLAQLTAQAADVVAESREQLAIAQQDVATMEAALPARREGLKKLAARDDVQSADIDKDLLSTDLLDDRAAATKEDLANLARRLESAWARIDSLHDRSDLPPQELQHELTSALTQLSGELLELSLLQARARLDTITFEPVELTPEQGFCIASRYRRDWMNARAALVDSWRLIHFNADDLQSDLDLVFNADIGNVGDNPVAFRGSNARAQMGLEFDSPLTRLAERNVYRQSLIEYQQARRTYYQFRDQVQADIRDTLRQLQLDQLNFELRRAAVHVAITQVDLARLRLSEPARPVAAAAPGQPLAPGGESQFGDTVARDLVNALVDLLLVQNDFLSVWVDNEVQRLQLDFDLGTMVLDERGLRVEHDQPIASFLEHLPDTAPCEYPEPCGKVGSGKADAPEPGFELGPQLELPVDQPDDGETLPLPEADAVHLPLSRFAGRK